MKQPAKETLRNRQSKQYARRNVSELKPHPINAEIYGENEDVSELVKDISKSGIVTTLTITDKDVILSGHRRWKSCKELLAQGDKRFETVNCEIFQSKDEDEQVQYLIISNKTREKTPWQKANEAEEMLKAEQSLAEKRKKAGIKIDLVAKSPQGSGKGRARDIVAKELRMRSGREVDRAAASVRKAKALKADGKIADAELIVNTYNKTSPSSAAELSAHIDRISEEDKQAIRNGQASVGKILSKYKLPTPAHNRPSKPPEKETEVYRECEKIVNEYNARSMGLIEKVRDSPVTEELLNNFSIAVGGFGGAILTIMNYVSELSEEEVERLREMITNAENKIQKLRECIGRK